MKLRTSICPLGGSRSSSDIGRQWWLTVCLGVCFFIVSKHSHASEPPETPSAAQYVATLPNGTHIEFLGINYYSEQRHAWWRADGTLLNRDPRDSTFKQFEYHQSMAREKAVGGWMRQFAFRITNLPHEKESYGYQFCHEEFDEFANSGVLVNSSDLTLLHFPLRPVRKFTTFRMGFDPLPEMLEGSFSVDGKKVGVHPETPALRQIDELIQPHQVKEVNGETQLSLKLVRRSGRLLFLQGVPFAIDKDGGRHALQHIGGGNGPAVYSVNMPLSRIDRFEYRLKVFRHLVTFENVALQPNSKTDVKLRIESLDDEPENTITLEKLTGAQSIRGQVIDEQGRPVANASLNLLQCQKLQPDELIQRGTVTPNSVLRTFASQSELISEADFRLTDTEGRFQFTGLPVECQFRIAVRHPALAGRDYYAATTQRVLPKLGGQHTIHTGFVNMILPAAIETSIRVLCPDTGSPAAKILLTVFNGEASQTQETNADGIVKLQLSQGEYGARMIPAAGTHYLVTTGKTFALANNAKSAQIDLELKIGGILEVTVVDADTGQPISNTDVWIRELEGAASNQNELMDRAWEAPRVILERPLTNTDGELRTLLSPDDYRIGIGFAHCPVGYRLDCNEQVTTVTSGRTSQITFRLKAAVTAKGKATSALKTATLKASPSTRRPALSSAPISEDPEIDLHRSYELLKKLQTLATCHFDNSGEIGRLDFLPPRKRILGKPVRQAMLSAIKEEAWPLINEIQTFESLTFIGTNLLGRLRNLRSAGSLRELHIASCEFDMNELMELARFPFLERIEVELSIFKQSKKEVSGQVGELSPDERVWFDRWISTSNPRYADRFDDAKLILLTDRILHKFSQLKRLKSIKLVHANPSTRGMESLGSLPELEEIDVRWQRFDLQGAQFLTKLPNLKSVQTIQANDEILAELAKLVKLEVLVVDVRTVTDKGIKSLSTNRSLRHLRLMHSQVSDVGLDALSEMKGLQSLNLLPAEKPITDSAADRLQQRLPNCKLILHP